MALCCSKGWAKTSAQGALLLLVAACDPGTGPDQVFVNTAVRVEIIGGASVQDSIGASVPFQIALTPEDDETPRPLRLQVALSAVGEDCGEPAIASLKSDEDDRADAVWILGDVAQDCVMEVRALSPAGTLVGVTRLDAVVQPGRAVGGWLLPGNAARDVEQVTMALEAFPLEDRNANPVAWRFNVVNGPAVVLGTDMDDDLSRTLVATDLGSGEVDIETAFGPFMRAAFDICQSDDDRWIRVFRSEDSGTIQAVCP